MFYFDDGDHRWWEIHWLVSSFYKVIRVFSVRFIHLLFTEFTFRIATRHGNVKITLYYFVVVRKVVCELWNVETKLNQLSWLTVVDLCRQSNFNEFIIIQLLQCAFRHIELSKVFWSQIQFEQQWYWGIQYLWWTILRLLCDNENHQLEVQHSLSSCLQLYQVPGLASPTSFIFFSFLSVLSDFWKSAW